MFVDFVVGVVVEIADVAFAGYAAPDAVYLAEIPHPNSPVLFAMEIPMFVVNYWTLVATDFPALVAIDIVVDNPASHLPIRCVAVLPGFHLQV